MGIKREIKRWLSKKILGLIQLGSNPPYKIIDTHNVKVGRESFHNGNFKIKGNGLLKIGSYCAFGEDIKIILSNHNYNYPSIQYSFYNYYFKELPYNKVNGFVEIGSDVWIGDNVVILPNIKIGNGVCIGSGAIVTKDIPDFAIVVGNPAKIIKYRFEERQILEINELKWWDWNDQKIIQNRDFFFKPFVNK